MIAVTIEGMYLVLSQVVNQRDMAKQLLTPLQLIALMDFSLKNYSCELFNLTRTAGKVELILTFMTAVCESWNVSDKYTLGIMLEILCNSSWTRLSVRIITAIKRQFLFHMVMHAFVNSAQSLTRDFCN